MTLTDHPLGIPTYRVREANGPADLAAAQALRHLAFHGTPGHESDGFDMRCRHVLIEDQATGRLECCFRVLLLPGGAALRHSYAAQFYDLTALGAYPGPVLELGRFCMVPGGTHPDVLRLAWGWLTRLVDTLGVTLLFGCSSFPGTDPALHTDALALLGARHLAPDRWRPGIKAPDVIPYATQFCQPPDMRRALTTMPPLLRSYLMMGGWVSDHAVVDPDLGTLHVFTGVEIATIPAARKRLLRSVAQ